MDVGLFDESGGTVARPAWQIIDAARHARVTGELRLELDPEAAATSVSVWLRDGDPYFAERSTDGTLGVRLLVEGHITLPQLQRGTVTVNGVEHIGRMFELEPTVDRAAVEVWVEQATDHVLTSIAAQWVGHYSFAPYKRHPSGVDRWSAPGSGPTRRKGTPAPRANPLDPTEPLDRHDDARTGGIARPSLSTTPSVRSAATAPAPVAPVAGAPSITPAVVPNEPSPVVTAVTSPPAPPLVTAAQAPTGAKLPPIPIISTPPATPVAGPVEKSLWIAVDPDPTPVADHAPTTPPTTTQAAPAPVEPAPVVPTLAPRPGEMPDPTPNTLVRHITAAVRDVVAKVDEPPAT